MDHVEGFVASGQEHKVFKLNSSMILNPTPLLSHEKFDKIILSFGFKYVDSKFSLNNILMF